MMRINLIEAYTPLYTAHVKDQHFGPNFLSGEHKLDVILAHCYTKHLLQEFHLSCWLLLQFLLQGPPSPTKYSKASSHTSVKSSVLNFSDDL